MNFLISNIKEQLETQLEEIKKVTYTLTINDPLATPELIEKLVPYCGTVRTLSIYNTTLKSLPNLSQLDQLVNLQLQCSALEEIKEYNFPPNLKEFIHREGNLKSIPEFIWKYESMYRIRLSDNSIEQFFLPSNAMANHIFINFPKLKNIKIGKSQPKILDFELFASSMLELDESFSYLDKISNLKVKAPIEKVNCDFSTTPLREIHCEHWNLEDYTFLNTISNMRWLQVASSKKKWFNLPNLNNWPNLNRLWIADCLDTTLTNAIYEGSNLIQLYVRKSNLVFIPEHFTNCKKLRDIQLTDLPPIDFADCLKYLNAENYIHFSEIKLLNFDNIPKDLTTNWKYLTLSNNEITYDNFDFLDHLPELASLRIWSSTVTSPLVFLRKKTVPIDNIAQAIPDFKFKKSKQFCSFCSAVENSGLPYEDKVFFVEYMATQKAFAVSKKWNWETILKATNISQVSFRKKLMNLIDDKIATNKNEQPITTNSLVYITGKPKVKITILKKQAAELGIQLSQKYTDKVTHVIVGMASNDYETLKDKTFTPLTANDLQRKFADTQPQFLKENLETNDNPELIENLGSLLKSPELTNVKVGLEMIKNGGMPPQIFEPLLVVQKTTADAKIRKLAGELLEIHAPAEWKSFLRDRLSFKVVDNPRKTEVDIRKQFRAVAKRTSPALAFKFSCMLFRQKGRGLRYALTAGLKKEMKKEAYQLLLKDNHFDFSRGLGFSKRPLNTDYYDMYNLPESSVVLPVLVLEIDTIHSLNLTNCRYNVLSKKITQFKDLKNLNLSTNELRSLPDHFAELKNLETLDFRFNKFKSFPTILSQLPNLKKIDFSGNHEFEVPKSFKSSHPNCEVVN